MRRWWRRQWRLAVLKRHCKVVNTRAAHRKKRQAPKPEQQPLRGIHTHAHRYSGLLVCVLAGCVCAVWGTCVREWGEYEITTLRRSASGNLLLFGSYALSLSLSWFPPDPQDPRTPAPPWPPSPIGYRRRKLKIRIRSTWRPFVGNGNGEKLQKTPRCG